MSRARAIASGLLILGAAACSSAAAQDPRQSYKRGLAALAEGQPRTARIEFLNGIKASPNDPALRLAQGRTYLLLGEGAAAEAELKRARQLGASEAATAHLVAHAYLLQGQSEPAVAEARKAAPEHAVYADRMLGWALSALGDNQGAAAAFGRALAAAPNESALWADIGRFRRSTGEVAGAIEAADRAVSLDPRNVEALTLRGELTRSQFGLAASVPWFERAIEVDPLFLPAAVERAATLGEIGRTLDMLAETRRILGFSPDNPNAWFLQAALAARGKNYTLARSLYARTRGALEHRPAAMLLAGAIDLQTGNPVQAAKRLQELLALQPANLRARRLLGAAQWRSGDSIAALRTLQPLADRADADTYSLTLVGQALARMGDSQAAARYFARAAAPPPAVGTVFVDGMSDAELARLRRRAESGQAVEQVELIRALIGRGQAGEALDRARRLQAANPGAPDAHVLAGDALAVAGDHRSAVAAYRRAANLAFTEPTALRLIDALKSAGDPRGASQVLGLFLRQNPQNVSALTLAANAHLQARQWDRAIALYERVRRRIGNGDATLLNNLAWAYLETGETERAIPLARRAFELDPRSAATADTLGWLLFKSGRRAEGLVYLEQAARGAPSDAEILAHLSQARPG
jgi:tetratricopeptide (TPR) repeat protein